VRQANATLNPVSMSHEDPSSFDAAAAHRRFSTECFNQAWELIEKPDRTRDDDEAMVLRAMASLWHWTQRPDCTKQNLAIGHWQVARVYALAGHGEAAMHHAQRSLALALAADCSPFYIGYAHEALARAAAVLDDEPTFQAHLTQARQCLAAVKEEKERALLEPDLNALAEGRFRTV